MISFIYHVRIDNEERLKNLFLTTNYFKQILPDCEIIVVEDNAAQSLNLQSDIKYIHHKNLDIYQKSKSYNIGANLAKNNILCFVDADIIISLQNIHRSVEQTLVSDDNIVIGYNGVAVYFNYSVKNKLTKYNFTYDFLDQLIDKSQIKIFYECNNYSIPNTNAVGGCLFMTKQTFKNINGFNPLFKGWGFEDNEIIYRSKILGCNLFKINTSKPFLLHLPHGDLTNDKSQIRTNKMQDESYYKNMKLFNSIQTMNKQQIMEYIKLW